MKRSPSARTFIRGLPRQAVVRRLRLRMEDAQNLLAALQKGLELFASGRGSERTGARSGWDFWSRPYACSKAYLPISASTLSRTWRSCAKPNSSARRWACTISRLTLLSVSCGASSRACSYSVCASARYGSMCSACSSRPPDRPGAGGRWRRSRAPRVPAARGWSGGPARRRQRLRQTCPPGTTHGRG